MNEQIKFLPEKPYTLVKYGKVIVFNDQNQFFLKQLQNANDTSTQVKKNTEQILNIILPPLYFKNENQENCYQQVVTTPAKVSDVVSLQQNLDQELLSQQGRETGICPIRERLYSECFDELIRQITVNCSHRGIMLVRVRDELRNTIETYQQLYLSSLGFGVRASLKGENEEKYLKNQIEKIQNEIQTLESDIEKTKDELNEISSNQQDELNKINIQYKQRMEVVQIEHEELKEKFQEKFTLNIPSNQLFQFYYLNFIQCIKHQEKNLQIQIYFQQKLSIMIRHNIKRNFYNKQMKIKIKKIQMKNIVFLQRLIHLIQKDFILHQKKQILNRKLQMIYQKI